MPTEMTITLDTTDMIVFGTFYAVHIILYVMLRWDKKLLKDEVLETRAKLMQSEHSLSMALRMCNKG